MQTHSCQGWAQSSCLKSHQTAVRTIHLLILNHPQEGQGPVGTLSRDKGAARCHCCTLLLLRQHRWCTPPLHSPVAPLKLAGAPQPCTLPQLHWSFWSHTLHLGDAPWSSGSGGPGGLHSHPRNGRLPYPGHYTDWNILPVFLWRRPIYLSYSFSLGDRLVCHTSKVYRDALRECRAGDTIFVLSIDPHYNSLVHPRKELFTHLRLWLFQL